MDQDQLRERLAKLKKFEYKFPETDKTISRTLPTYMGITPFTVKVDDSRELSHLIAKARALKGLTHLEKLAAVKDIAVNAMSNAYEMMVEGKDKREKELGRDIVFNPYPLSHALEKRAGCCRYQGALFFVLGFEAELGDKLLLQAAPVGNGVNSVFNDLYHEGRLTHVSIFLESLKNKDLDYSRQNPKVFEQPFSEVPGMMLYSYLKTPEGIKIIEESKR